MVKQSRIYFPREGFGVMNITICDDNLKFAQILQAKIRSYFAQIDKSCSFQLFSDPKKLLHSDLSSTQILFLDVDMPGINGILAAKEIRRFAPDLFLVFVTAWIEYAPEGYLVNAFRYLLKQRLDDELPACLDDIRRKMAEEQAKIQLLSKDGLLDIRINEITYLEGSSYRMVLVHNVDGTVVECRGKLSEFEAQLEGNGFLRIQKSFVVNMRYIQRIKCYRAYLRNGEVLHTTAKNYGDLCNRYLLWRGQQL